MSGMRFTYVVFKGAQYENRFSGSAFFDSQMPFVAADNFFAQAQSDACTF